MTPTLAGRWQTRILMFVFIWLPVTAAFVFYGIQAGLDIVPVVPFRFVCCIFFLGLLLDPVYIWLQQRRWERDWPFVFQFLAMILEFLIVVGIVAADALPVLPREAVLPDAAAFRWLCLHFTLVFVPSFLALLGGFQLFLVRWRFKGGEWGRL